MVGNSRKDFRDIFGIAILKLLFVIAEPCCPAQNDQEYQIKLKGCSSFAINI